MSSSILNIYKNNVKIYKSNNNFCFEFEENEKIIKRNIPINKLKVINCFSNIELNSYTLLLANEYDIKINIYHPYTHNYISTFYNQNYKNIKMFEKQLNIFKDKKNKLIKSLYNGILDNQIFVLLYFQKNLKYGSKITKIIKSLKILKEELENFHDYENFMLFEGRIWQIFYSFLDIVLINNFKFENRSKRPPENEVNSLISFFNMRLYSIIKNQMMDTQLNTQIGFLHSLEGTRDSFCLDLAEIFKPLFVIKFVINLINTKKITKKDFEKDFRLKFDSLKIVEEEFKKFLEETIYHHSLKRKVSFYYLIKLEIYKFYSVILNNNNYNPINFKEFFNEKL